MQPGPIGATPLDTTAPATPKPANAPPATVAESLGTLKEIQNEFADYKVEGEIIADGSDGVSTGANTAFFKVSSTNPTYESANGLITKFNGKFKFSGKITIQTNYASDAKTSTLSCYGRGTTDTDLANRDITLGFHENCHRADYKAYLKTNSLPTPPAMSIGQKATDYDNAAAAFNTALTKFYRDMEADSIKKTDEVGFTLNKANKTNSCFDHILP